MIALYLSPSVIKDIKASQHILPTNPLKYHECGREAEASDMGKTTERGLVFFQKILDIIPTPEAQRRELPMRCLPEPRQQS